MVKQIQCYEDESGKLHKSAFDAHRDRISALREALPDMSATMPPAPAQAFIA